MSKIGRSPYFRTVSLLFAGLIVLVCSTYYVLDYTVDRLVMKDAETEAYGWADYLAKNLTDIEQITAGAEPSQASRTFIENARSIGDVFLFKLFDPEGRLRLISDELDKGRSDNPNLAKHNPRAAQVLATGQAHTAVKEGKRPKRRPLYAETYVPVIKDGRTVAIVEVYMDQTGDRNLIRSQFAAGVLTLMLITGLAFGVPATAFYLRTRQKVMADERIHFLAHHDAMTTLMNRSNFIETLTGHLSDSWRYDACIAVHYIDLDHFKTVNDSLGHDVGDQLLGIMADRLRSITRDDDLAARFGGDEFVIAQFNVESAQDSEAFAQRAIKVLGQPTTVGDHDIVTTVSIGTATAPEDGTDAVSLLKHADTALYKAKADGRNRHRLFNPEMYRQLHERRRLERAIRTAIQNDGFDLHFQPLFDIEGSRLTGFEALLRLPNGENGFIPPNSFVPLAEEMGLISQIGKWVLMQACTVASEWPEYLPVAVNLSPEQFKDEGVVGAVSEALTTSGLAPSRLELEITEGLLMQNTDAVMEQLDALKQLGVAIVMDDFGTGYSSLSYLWRFPFDKIKIDRSFISAATESDPNLANILQTIVSLGHLLNMRVTAEGVETVDQATLLKQLACDQLQGFLFGRPMPRSEAALVVLRDIAAANSDGGEGRPAPKDGFVSGPDSTESEATERKAAEQRIKDALRPLVRERLKALGS
ncbi:MAG: putative bifunctional diguanylate cyclase/phosphodiesterase [Methyloligellaceae bacterium]